MKFLLLELRNNQPADITGVVQSVMFAFQPLYRLKYCDISLEAGIVIARQRLASTRFSGDGGFMETD